MKKVILYGELRKKFGKEFVFNVSSPAQALRALCALVKGFQNYLAINSSPGYLIKSGKRYLDEEHLLYNNNDEIIRIVPYVVGSGGLFKVILGAALIALSLAYPAVAPYLLKFGISMFLSGIAELLFTPPIPEIAASNEESKPSYCFDGPVNTTLQGNPVPLCYGKLLVGSQVISAVIIAKDI